MIEIEREDTADEQAQTIAALKEQLAASDTKTAGLSERVKELERDNARLKIQADNPKMVTVSDPQTAILREKLDESVLR